MSDKSPEDNLPESLDEATEAPEAASADVENADDAIIEEMEKDLPADDKAAAPIKRKTAKAPVKKQVATRSRKEAETEHEDLYKADNPAHFVRQSVGELKKVVWPTWPTLVKYFFAVLAFVLFVILFVFLLDGAFGWGLLQILGK